MKYAIRIPANDALMRDTAELLTRPVGRPSHKPVVCYKGFLYQGAIWKMAWRVVAKLESHAGAFVHVLRGMAADKCYAMGLLSSEAPTSRANVSQCLGWARCRPARISAAYGWESPKAEAMAGTVIPARRG